MGEFLRRMESMEQRYEQRASAAKCGGTGGLDWVLIVFVAGPGFGGLGGNVRGGQSGWLQGGERGRWKGGLEEWKAGDDMRIGVPFCFPKGDALDRIEARRLEMKALSSSARPGGMDALREAGAGRVAKALGENKQLWGLPAAMVRGKGPCRQLS